MNDQTSLTARFAAIPAPLRGAIWATFAACSFACGAGLIRHVSQTFHPFEIAFFRNLFGLLFMAPWVFRSGFGVLRTKRIGLLSLRALVALGAMLSWFSALSLLPLGEAIALSFITPIMATILAALILRETVRLRRWTAVAIGFAGMLVILRPGVAVIDPAAFLVLLTAVCFASSGTIVKTLSRTESPNAIVTWMVIFLAPISIIPAAFVWQTPSLEMIPWLAAVGAATTLGHVGLTRAYDAADASYVQPFQYATLPFAALIGYLAFAETPDVWTWIGAGIIAGSALYIARRETLAAQDSATPALPGDGSGMRPPRHRAGEPGP